MMSIANETRGMRLHKRRQPCALLQYMGCQPLFLFIPQVKLAQSWKKTLHVLVYMGRLCLFDQRVLLVSNEMRTTWPTVSPPPWAMLPSIMCRLVGLLTAVGNGMSWTQYQVVGLINTLKHCEPPSSPSQAHFKLG